MPPGEVDSQQLADIEASLKRISGTLDVLIYARAAELPPGERRELLAELDALKKAEALAAHPPEEPAG